VAICNLAYTDTLVHAQFWQCQVNPYKMCLETRSLDVYCPDQHSGLLLDNSCRDDGAALLLQVHDCWWSFACHPDSKHIGSTPHHACPNLGLRPPCTQCPLCIPLICLALPFGAIVKPDVRLPTLLQMNPHHCVHLDKLLQLSSHTLRRLLSAEAAESKFGTDL